MSSGDSTSAAALVSAEPPIQNEWASDLCDCFTYRTEAEKIRFSPIFMPCTCFCPCVMMGRIKSRLLEEPHVGCCHMGTRGRCFCMGACCLAPCLPLFSLNVRQKAMRLNNVPGGCCEEWKACCCPCSLFQVYVSLDEWELGKKTLTKTNSARKKDEMKLRAIQKQKQKKLEEKLPPQPTQMNGVTELVMTYMGDIMGDDEDDLSDEEDYSDEEVEEYDCSPSHQGTSSLQRGSDSSSHMPTRIDTVQVTIPEGHFAGSVFQIENRSGGVTEVVVPEGGKPGMKMQVPYSTAAPLPSPPLPVMVQEGSIQVAIPPGLFAGHVFRVQTSDGRTVEVVVPEGGKPGMMMQIPQAHSQLPPDPEASRPPKKNKKKLVKQRSSTSPSGEKRIQVTIPEGCSEGDIFVLQPVHRDSQSIKVRVPRGGKPGMRVQITVPADHNKGAEKKKPEKREKEKKKEKTPKKDTITRHPYGAYGGGGKKIKSTAVVTIPSGVSEGEPFVALDADTGRQVLVLVPAGARAGKIMKAEIVEDST